MGSDLVSGWLVNSRYAHQFVLLSVVVVPHPISILASFFS